VRPHRPPAAPREAAPASATATASASDDRVYGFSELPESVRRELPKISYGGGSYSPDKASRLAFLNGQVFHEGDTIAPGLVVRQVKPKGVILAYKGYRFELGP
jgi:general secretion pathway protein B